MKKLFVFIFVFLSTLASAQSYKWIKGGGSVSSFKSGAEWETIRRMCTDANGNLYIAAFVGDNNITADTFYKAGVHYGGFGGKGLDHIFFASYSCEGAMRWGKLIEGDFFNQVYGLEYDGKSSIYLAGVARTGIFSYSPIGLKYFGNDTVVSSGNLNLFLAKYDTSGKLRWLRFVGADNASTFYGTKYGEFDSPYSPIEIDGQGHIHYYAHILSDVRITPTLVGKKGTYDIMYDTTGDILNVVRMEIDSTLFPSWNFGGITINKNSGNVYSFVIFSGAETSYIGAYNPAGSQLWVDSLTAGTIVGDMVYDGNNGIYGTAWCVRYSYIVIAGDTIKNDFVGGYVSVIFKLDTLGNLKWTFKLNGGGFLSMPALTLLPNGTIAATGTMQTTVAHGYETLLNPSGNSPIIVVFDTSGNVLYKLDRLLTDALYNEGDAITSDNANNIYLGGYVSDSVYVKGLPAYHNIGGESDFYIVKYGYNCNCTSLTEPTPNFTSSGTGIVNFVYTGLVTPDSVRWNFGDGGNSTLLNPTHSFHDTGVHKVCLTVFACDSGTFCNYIHTTVSVPTFATQPIISVYPNPISGQFFIEGAEIGTKIQILNILGQIVYEGAITDKKQQVNTGDLRLGTYLLVLTDKDGRRESMTIVKQ